MHIFRCSEFSGEPSETEEMRPQWFAFSEIPFAQMWPDDSLWIPDFLAGKTIKGEFQFSDPKTITSHTLEVS